MVPMTGLCNDGHAFDISKILFLLFVLVVAASFFSIVFALTRTASPCSQSDNITSRSFGFIITLVIALQFVPTASNLWDVRGWEALLALAFPPVMVYRLLLFVEFKDTSFVYRLAGTGKPLATVIGNDILFDVGVMDGGSS